MSYDHEYFDALKIALDVKKKQRKTVKQGSPLPDNSSVYYYRGDELVFFEPALRLFSYYHQGNKAISQN